MKLHDRDADNVSGLCTKKGGVGREIATPAEAREILSLKPLK